LFSRLFAKELKDFLPFIWQFAYFNVLLHAVSKHFKGKKIRKSDDY